MKRLAALAVLVGGGVTGGTARADDVVYVEALGKGGAYGVGFEHAIADAISIGIAASWVEIEQQQVTTVAPYVHGRIVGNERHGLIAELGGILAHSKIPSPVDGWDGMTDTGGGGFVAAGYEYTRGHFLGRATAAVVAGEGGLAPMIGFLFGARL